MKRLIIILSLFILCPVLLSAQEQISFKTGLMQANAIGKDVKGTHWKSGLAVGTSFIKNIGNLLSMETELMYTENGYVSGGNIIKEEFIDTYYFNYYKLGILFNLYLNRIFNLPPRNLYFYPTLGVNIAALVNSKIKNKNPNSVNEVPTNITFYDFGVVLGFGVGYKTGIGIISIETRYDKGLVNLNVEQATYNYTGYGYYEEDSDWVDVARKNEAWQFLLSYSVGIFD